MNSVIKRIVYRVELLFVSPVNVSSGQEGMTDSDVLRDYDGKPFISGSSIAGHLERMFNLKIMEMTSLVLRTMKMGR